MNTKELLFHHSDSSMSSLDILWEWVPLAGNCPGYWRRDAEHEALKVLKEAAMLPEVTEEELPF